MTPSLSKTPNPTLPPISRFPAAGSGRDGWPARAVKAPGLFHRLAVILLALLLATPALAVDPPYQRQMERLAEIMGSLYFLQPLCQSGAVDWRAEMADLIALDEPDDDRRQRLTGAFNAGYTAYARFHRSCTPTAREALERLLTEAETVARDIHTRFAE